VYWCVARIRPWRPSFVIHVSLWITCTLQLHLWAIDVSWRFAVMQYHSRFLHGSKQGSNNLWQNVSGFIYNNLNGIFSEQEFVFTSAFLFKLLIKQLLFYFSIAVNRISSCLLHFSDDTAGVAFLYVWNNDVTLGSSVSRINCYIDF